MDGWRGDVGDRWGEIVRSRYRWLRSRLRLPRERLRFAGWLFGKREKNSVGLLRLDARATVREPCYVSNFERKLQMRATRPAYLECDETAVRTQYGAFLRCFMHQRPVNGYRNDQSD